MSRYVRKKTYGDTDWFVHDRFGMFIHFGLYSLPARHEWIKMKECISEEKYSEYFEHFNPDMLNASEWAESAKKAGMKYAVFTAKHHEGFCLFDSEYTDYKSTNTPCGRDLVGEFVNAFRAAGLKVGLYYSLIDWHHSDFPIDYNHPRRNDTNAPDMDKGRDMKKYAEYMRNQITELLTKYGKIDILWLDYSYPPSANAPAWMQNGGGKGKEQWESEKLIELIRSINPNIILNDRAQIPQDLVTPEQNQRGLGVFDKETGELLTWESCQTFSGSWGYFRDETSWKTPSMLITMLVKTVSGGGNLIMNVGPTARGCFDVRANNALGVYGDWMKYNSRSIYGCTLADKGISAPEEIGLTQSEDGKRLYIHWLEYPHSTLNISGLSGRVKYAQLLSDGSEIGFKDGVKQYDAVGNCLGEYTSFTLPGSVLGTLDPVIEIFLK